MSTQRIYTYFISLKWKYKWFYVPCSLLLHTHTHTRNFCESIQMQMHTYVYTNTLRSKWINSKVFLNQRQHSMNGKNWTWFFIYLFLNRYTNSVAKIFELKQKSDLLTGSHSPYSLDLTSCYFYSFGKMHSSMEEKSLWEHWTRAKGVVGQSGWIIHRSYKI